MITSVFIDTCYLVLLNNNPQLKKSMSFYTDLKEIVDFYTDSYETPVILKNKIDCIYQICKMKISGKNEDAIVDSISMTPKYEDLIDYIEKKRNDELSIDQINNCIKQVRMRKKYTHMVKDYKNVSSVLSDIDNGSYESIDDIIIKYENLIKELYLNIVNSNRIVEVESASYIDIFSDDYEAILDTIEDKYDTKNRIPTGIEIFDKKVFYGGFEKSRLYMFGGGSGAGKSTLLDNIMIQSALKQAARSQQINDKKPKVYLLITLENQIDETFMRIYQCLFGKTTQEFLHDIKEKGKDKIKILIMNKIANAGNIKFIIKYFQSRSITPMDIDSIVTEVSETYGADSIQLVGVDYLDLLCCDVSRDAYRHELGDITLSLKSIAVTHSIPLLTVTQLNRGVYSVTSADELRVDMMGESMEKVNHSDYISMQAKDVNDNGLVHFRVGKNRSGASDLSIDFKVDFGKYKFIRPVIDNANTVKKVDDTNTNGLMTVNKPTASTVPLNDSKASSLMSTLKI